MGDKINMKGYVIQFQTECITHPSVYKQLHKFFSTYGDVLKLYLNYKNRVGKVYYKKLSEAKTAYTELPLNSEFPMTVQPPILEGFNKNLTTAKTMPKEEEIEVSLYEIKYGVFGNAVEILRAQNGEIYIPFNSVKIGYKLVDYKKDPDQHTTTKLKAFLLEQANIFLSINQCTLSHEVVKNNIESFNKNLTIAKTRPEEEEIEVSLHEIKYDVFGNAVEILRSQNGEIYIPYNSVKIGYKLVDYKKDLDQHTTTKLKAFLLAQANIFLSINQCTLSHEVVKNNIESTVENVIPRTVNFNEGSTKPASVSRTSTINNNSSRYSVCSSDSDKQKILSFPQVELIIGQSVEIQVVSCIENNIVWVRLQSAAQLYDTICKDTAFEAAKGSSYRPKEKAIAAVCINNVWYRVFFITVNPTSFYCIDTGKKYQGNNYDFFAISEKLRNIPGQALRVKISDNFHGNLRTGNTCIVQPLRKYAATSTYLVRVEENSIKANADHCNDNRKPQNTNKNLRNPAYNSNDSYTKPQNLNVEKRNQLSPNHSKIESSFNNAAPTKTENNFNAKPTNFESNSNATHVNIERKNTTDRTNINKNTQSNKENIPVQVVKESKLELPVRKNVSEFIANSSGFVQSIKMLSDDSFLAFIISESHETEVSELQNIEPETAGADFKAKVGDTICFKTSQPVEGTGWVRALILDICNSEYKVALLEHGIIETTKSIQKLPEKYMNMSEYIITCYGDKNDIKKIEEDEFYSYTSTQNFTLTIKLEKADESINFKCKSYTYKLSQKIITTLPPYKLTSKNDKVKIVSENNGLFALRTKDSLMTLQGIIEQINKETVDKLDQDPIVNQLILHKRDTEFKRAQVKNIDNNKVKLYYIDYGCSDIANKSDLYYLPEHHATVGGTVSLVKLKDFEGGQFSEDSIKFISHCAKKTIFTVTEIENDVVTLVSDNGNLSENLKILEKPKFKTIDDIEKNRELSVNEIVSFIPIMQDDLDQGLIKCYLNDNDNIVTLEEQLEMAGTLKTPNELHKGEICIAKYEDAWYRAVIEEVNPEKDSYLVYYIDFGNKSTVSLKDTRQITEPFLKIPPMAIDCRLKDILDKYNGNISSQLFNKLINLVESAIYEAKILSKEGNLYNISIPVITNQL